MSESLARYLAYMSDVGEAFRPVIPLSAVRATYGISWAYCGYDVAQRVKQGSAEDSTRTAIRYSLFHAIASMGLPALTVNFTVRTGRRVLARLLRPGSALLRTLPTTCGLAIIPALPFLYDHPVEQALQRIV